MTNVHFDIVPVYIMKAYGIALDKTINVYRTFNVQGQQIAEFQATAEKAEVMRSRNKLTAINIMTLRRIQVQS
jgi:hypothetical protein